jgi:hypothetical protein
MAKPRKPNPDLTIYLGSINAAFQLWRSARRPVTHSMVTGAEPEELLAHIEYLAHVRRAAAAIAVPPGGEAVQRALLSAFDSVLDSLPAGRNEQRGESKQQATSTPEDYQNFEMELVRLTRQAAEVFDY